MQSLSDLVGVSGVGALSVGTFGAFGVGAARNTLFRGSSKTGDLSLVERQGGIQRCDARFQLRSLPHLRGESPSPFAHFLPLCFLVCDRVAVSVAVAVSGSGSVCVLAFEREERHDNVRARTYQSHHRTLADMFAGASKLLAM